ncbi:MAG: hypothetical protein LBK40_06065 [Spirochaetaceae bacterium]|nr:hypothetical protein [Spirochaetaceae bacterium]
MKKMLLKLTVPAALVVLAVLVGCSNSTGGGGGNGGGGADALDGTTWRYTYSADYGYGVYLTQKSVLRFNSPYCNNSITVSTNGMTQSDSVTYEYIVSGNRVYIIGLADGTFSGNTMYLGGVTYTK